MSFRQINQGRSWANCSGNQCPQQLSLLCCIPQCTAPHLLQESHSVRPGGFAYSNVMPIYTNTNQLKSRWSYVACFFNTGCHKWWDCRAVISGTRHAQLCKGRVSLWHYHRAAFPAAGGGGLRPRGCLGHRHHCCFFCHVQQTCPHHWHEAKLGVL